MNGAAGVKSFARGPRLSLASQGPLYSAKGPDGQTVALQVIPARRLPPPETMCLVEQEIRAAAALHHPNVLAFTRSQRSTDGSLYLVRDMRDGVLLSDRLHKSGRPPVRAAFDLLEEVLAGLAAAHERRICHHHLRPDKILLEPTPQGDRVLLLDLGMARLVGRHWGMLSAAARLGGKHALPATPEQARYLAPEQVQNPQSANARADVYAAGVLLCELLCGRPIFSESEPQVLVQAHANRRPPTLAELAPDRMFSAELEALAAAMLAKVPAQRPADAGVVLERLRQLRQAGDTVVSIEDDDDPGWRVHRASLEPRRAATGPAPVVVEIEELAGADLPKPKAPPPVLRGMVIEERVRDRSPSPENREERPREPPLIVEERVRPGAVREVQIEPPPSDGGRPPPPPNLPSPASWGALGLGDLLTSKSKPAADGDLTSPEQPALADDTVEATALDAERRSPRRWWPVGLASLLVAGVGVAGAVWLQLQDQPAPVAVRRPGRPTAALRATAKAPPPAAASAAPASQKAPPLGPRSAPAPVAAAPPPAPAAAAVPVVATARPAPTPAVVKAPPRGVVVIRISSFPPGAEVLQNGDLLGSTPYAEVRRRTSRLAQYELRRSGYLGVKVDVRMDRDRDISQVLEPDMSIPRLGGPM